MSRTSWWASKVRQLGAHLVARVSARERDELAAWLRPAELQLFDAMHVADRRHGLDVAAVLRRGGGRHRAAAAGGLVARRGVRAVGLAARTASAGLGRDADAPRDPCGDLGCARGAGRAPAVRRGPRAVPGRSAGRQVRPGVPRRGRGVLMVLPGHGTTPPAVEFGDGRRPEAATRVTLPAFDGPLALLLAL